MQGAASGLHVLHGGVQRGSEEKGNSHLVEASGELIGWQVDVHAERFHDVGGAAFGGHAAIAMFGNADAGSGNDEGSRGGDVEGAAGIASSAAGIDEGVAFRVAGVKNRSGVEIEGDGGGTDGLGESDNFFDGLAFHVQGDEEGGDLRIGALTG